MRDAPNTFNLCEHLPKTYLSHALTLITVKYNPRRNNKTTQLGELNLDSHKPSPSGVPSLTRRQAVQMHYQTLLPKVPLG